MQNLKNPKLAITISTALLLMFAAPAEAYAPKPSRELMLQNLALTNPKHYAKIKMAEYGWFKQQYVCLTSLWGKESSWNHKADNPNSTAFGIAQMLNEKSTQPLQQIDNGLRYIKKRYEQPCNAWKFWRSHYWY